MIGHFDEAFYKNKRAALLSSLALIAATFTSVHIGRDGQILNAFHVNDVSSTIVIMSLIIVCAYLNISYILHYKTEVPGWIRDPEAGIQKVEELTKKLDEQKQQANRQEKLLVGALKRHEGSMEVLEARLKYGSPPNPGPTIEVNTAKHFGKKRGPLYTGVFNEISAAVNADKNNAGILTKNLNWETITEVVTERAGQIVKATITEETQRLMGAVHEDITRHIDESKLALQDLAKIEGELFKELSTSNQKIQRAVRDLRVWTSAMNIRLRGQFYYLPVMLFMLANIYSIGSLIFGQSIYGFLPGAEQEYGGPG